MVGKIAVIVSPNLLPMCTSQLGNERAKLYLFIYHVGKWNTWKPNYARQVSTLISLITSGDPILLGRGLHYHHHWTSQEYLWWGTSYSPRWMLLNPTIMGAVSKSYPLNANTKPNELHIQQHFQFPPSWRTLGARHEAVQLLEGVLRTGLISP